MTTATKDLIGRRVRAGSLFGQLTGWNHDTGRVWVLDEVTGLETVQEGVTPELALLTCTSCGKKVNRLFADAWDLEDSTLRLCVEESRERAQNIKRTQTCDWCGDAFAYRNAHDRENIYLDTKCHVKRGVPIQQNKWAPRISAPLGVRAVEECLYVSTGDCKGEVRWRGGKYSAVLCNGHAGRVSAGDPYADRTL